MAHSAPHSGKHRWYRYPLLLLLAVLVLAVGFIGFLSLTEYRPDATQPADTGSQLASGRYEGEPLRILTFNTGYGGLGKSSDFLMDGGKGTGAEDPATVEENMAGIASILEKNPADIYMIQEIDQKSRRTFDLNQLEAYAQVLPEHQWYYAPNYRCKFVPYPLRRPIAHIDSGVATFSRFPASDAQRISLPNPFSWPVRTANLKRCILSTRFPVEDTDRELVVLNFHLEAYDDGAGKLAQTRLLMEILQQEYEKGNFVIAGGDFNQIFPGVETVIKPTSQWIPGNLDPLPKELEGWRYVYDDSVPTCRLLNQPYDPDSPLTQFYVIDGFILSPNLEVQQVRTLKEDFQYSDHNPVLLEVVPKVETH